MFSRTMTGTSRTIAVLITMLAAMPARSQTIPGAVLARSEPHHHPAYEDQTLRVLRVHIGPHDTTLLHEHDPDYFWVALGASEFVNAPLGKPDAVVKSPALGVHYAAGHFAHVARNPGTSPFDNITVELLGTQSHVRNLCEAALAGQPLDCPRAVERPANAAGVTEHRAFTSDQLLVSVATLQPGAALRATSAAPSTWVIALDTADTGHALTIDGGGRWVGGTYRASGSGWAVRNRGSRVSRVVTVVRLSDR